MLASARCSCLPGVDAAAEQGKLEAVLQVSGAPACAGPSNGNCPSCVGAMQLPRSRCFVPGLLPCTLCPAMLTSCWLQALTATAWVHTTVRSHSQLTDTVSHAGPRTPPAPAGCWQSRRSCQERSKRCAGGQGPWLELAHGLWDRGCSWQGEGCQHWHPAQRRPPSGQRRPCQRQHQRCRPRGERQWQEVVPTAIQQAVMWGQCCGGRRRAVVAAVHSPPRRPWYAVLLPCRRHAVLGLPFLACWKARHCFCWGS